MSGKGPTDGINESINKVEKKFTINFTKANPNFHLYLYYNSNESYFIVIWKFKVYNSIPWYEFYFGIVSKDFPKDEMSEISLNGILCDFSVDQSSFEKRRYTYNYLCRRTISLSKG